MPSNNAIDLQDAGIPIYDGAGTFSSTTTVDHAVLIGDAGNAINNVGPLTDGQLVIGSTGNDPVAATLTSSDGSVVFTPGPGSLDLSAFGVNIQQDQIFYVGKHGNDLNSGRNIEQAFLTFGAALSAASGETPSAVNRFAIVCFDDGIYTENITTVSFVDIFAPNADLTGTIAAVDNVNCKFREQNVADGLIGVFKSAGTGTFRYEVDSMNVAGSGIGIACISGILMAKWKTMIITNGFGIGDLTSATAHMHINGGDLYILGTGTAVARAFTGSTVGHIDHILNMGAGSGTAINNFDGEMDLTIDSIQTTDGINISLGTLNLSIGNLVASGNAYNVSGGTLNLTYNNLSGARTQTGGTAKTWTPHVSGTSGQILQSAGTGNEPTYTTATYPSTTAQGDLLSSTTANSIVALSKDTNATRYLANTGLNNNAAWDQVELTNGVSGILPIANGGTNTNTFANTNGVAYFDGTSLTNTSEGATGTVLIGTTGNPPSFSATPSVTSITISNSPVSTTDGTNKAYVDGIAAGFDWKDTTQAATTGALTVTYNNGAAGVGATLTNAGAQAVFALDGYTAPVGERVLIKDQASTLQNGIYVVTDAGSGATNWVLTRAADYDTPAEMDEGSLVPVQNGTVNQNTLWLQNVSVTTIGVDPITYQKFQNAPFSTTEHATLVGGANDTIVSLGLGTANQVLTSNGAGVDPSYQNPFSYRLVQSTTASGAADIQFLNMSANTKYFFDFDLQCTSSAQNIILEYSTDNGSSWVTSGYRSGVHYLPYDSVSMTNFNTTDHCILAQGTSNSRNQQGYFYLSTRERASVIGQALKVNVSSFGSVRIASDFGSGGSSLNAVRIRAASGNISGFANMYVRIS